MVGGWARRIRQDVGWLVLAVAGGATLGLLVHLLRFLPSAVLAAVIGAVATVVAVLAVRNVGRSLAVSEVVVNVPQLSRITFAVTKDRRGLAYRIVNQMATRIAVQRLDDDAGDAREALDSLHALFGWLRTALDEEPGSHPPGRPNVDVLAMNMLNCQLRPFLAYWHPRLRDWRSANEHAPESEWPENRRFRQELVQLQDALRPMAVAFAKMAGYADWTEIIGLSPDTPPRRELKPASRTSLRPASPRHPLPCARPARSTTPRHQLAAWAGA